MNTRAFLIILSLLLLVYLFFKGLGDALMPLGVSFGLAYLLFPVIHQLEAKGIQRHWAVAAVFLAISFVVLLALVLIVPGLLADFKSFVTSLPTNVSAVIAKVEGLLRDFGFTVDLSRQQIVDYLKQHSDNISKGVFKGVTASISGLLAILNIFLIPLFFFYLVDDYENIMKNIESLIPKRLKPRIDSYFRISNEVLSGYIRGQLMVALCLGVLYALGLKFVGLKFGVLIGLLSGFISIIPYAGFTLGFLMAITVSLANFTGYGELVGIVLVYGVVQTLEGFLITPKLVGNKVGLSAFATMLALIVGGNLLGLVGMLAAIPLAAIGKFILADLLKEYRQLEINQA